MYWQNKGGLGDKPAYNANQQEECDDAEEDLLLLRIEAESNCNIDTMPKRLLGNVQYLGTIPVSPNSHTYSHTYLFHLSIWFYFTHFSRYLSPF